MEAQNFAKSKKKRCGWINRTESWGEKELRQTRLTGLHSKIKGLSIGKRGTKSAAKGRPTTVLT